MTNQSKETALPCTVQEVRENSGLAEKLREVQKAFVDLYSVTTINRDEQYLVAGRAATAIDELSEIIPAIESIEARQGVDEAALGEDDAYIIRFEDPDRTDELFSGCGAREAAFKRYTAISAAWNATLFHGIKINWYEPERQPHPSQHTITEEEAVQELIAAAENVMTYYTGIIGGVIGKSTRKALLRLDSATRALSSQAHIVRKESSK